MSGEVRWQGLSHEEIHALLQAGPGGGASSGVTGIWAEVGALIEQADARVTAAFSGSGSDWAGPSADAARAAMTELARWALDAALDAQVTTAAVLGQADAADRLRVLMPPPVTAAEATPTTDPGLALAESYRLDALARERAEDAARLMDGYTNAGYEHRRHMDYWTLPPQVTVEVAPAGGAGGPGVGYPGGPPVGPAGVDPGGPVAGQGAGPPGPGTPGAAVAGQPGAGPGSAALPGGAGLLGAGAGGSGIGAGAGGPGLGVSLGAGAAGPGAGGPGAAGSGATGRPVPGAGAPSGRGPGSPPFPATARPGGPPGAPGARVPGRSSAGGSSGSPGPGRFGAPGGPPPGSGGASRAGPVHPVVPAVPPRPPAPPGWRDLVARTPAPGPPGEPARPPAAEPPRAVSGGPAGRGPVTGHPALYPPFAGGAGAAGGAGETRQRPAYLLDDEGAFVDDRRLPSGVISAADPLP